MAISLLRQFFFISILSTIIIITNFTHAHGHQCLDDQKTLLLELKNDLIFNSSVSEKLVHWNQIADCCMWKGVECDGAGHVISLQLDNETISGGLENSSSLFSLKYLEKLNLAHNEFNYTQIPKGIGNLKYLTHLNLSCAAFGGQVPIELSFLRRLVSLVIYDSSFCIRQYEKYGIRQYAPYYQDFPPLKLEHPNLKMLIENMTGLRELYLDSVDISAQKSEWYHVISSSLPDLRNLSLCCCILSGPLDPFLSRFHSLTILRLDGNNLSAVVPNFFANFSSLITLSLRNCSLKGSLDLPNNSFIGLDSSTHSRGTSNLVHLNLAYNSLSGSIPQSLFGLASLEVLILAGNQFSGQLNEFPILNFSNMYSLVLRSNRLEGPIPESLFQLESLESLSLSNNFFNGTFQLEKIQRLRNLKFIWLSYNNLTVDANSIDSSFSTFPQLQWLGLASCNLHSFPDLIRNQSEMKYLDLSNNRIKGEIPRWIWEIGNGTLQTLNLSFNLLVDLQKPYKIPSSIDALDLHSNQLQGDLPLSPQAAYYVDYSNNNFDKSIALDIGNFTFSLGFFSLANNSLTGSIPTSLCNATDLEILDLSFNNFSGNIPPCLLENIEYLQVFNLEGNNISGDIPDRFSVNCSIETLDLSNNNLGGQIPKSLGNCKSLVAMNVGSNNIDDSFPCMLSSTLRVLVLRANKFHGEVRCHESWRDLQIIDIASNNFNGTLYPISFSSWKGMMLESDGQMRHDHTGSNFLHPRSFNYRIGVTLTIKGLELTLVKIWRDYTYIDFSFNNFHGQLPDSIGDLISLHLLNLSHNNLTGAIPKSFGKLMQLESLDLSTNQLTGTIPVELARLTYLSVLNLSYNKLVGKIPIGPQLQTFSPSSFEGNTGLCGPPLNLSCSNTDEDDLLHGSLQSHGKMEIEWEYVSAALGYVVGLGCIVWLLLCCQNLRRKYFEKVEEVLEKIFDLEDRKRRQRRRVLRNQ